MKPQKYFLTQHKLSVQIIIMKVYSKRYYVSIFAIITHLHTHLITLQKSSSRHLPSFSLPAYKWKAHIGFAKIIFFLVALVRWVLLLPYLAPYFLFIGKKSFCSTFTHPHNIPSHKAVSRCAVAMHCSVPFSALLFLGINQPETLFCVFFIWDCQHRINECIIDASIFVVVYVVSFGVV